ncbi:hypothetical protein EG827_07035 [bacterium]|nr:hypothetical protein [bacterium]
MVQRYLNRISCSIFDRIDIFMEGWRGRKNKLDFFNIFLFALFVAGKGITSHPVGKNGTDQQTKAKTVR